MNIDQRLHHAARELRELQLEPPPLGPRAASGSSWSRRLPALVAPVLFVLGGLVAVAGGLRSSDETGQPITADRPVGLDVAVPTSESPADDTDPAPSGEGPSVPSAPSAREELELIANIVANADPSPAPTSSSLDRGIPGRVI